MNCHSCTAHRSDSEQAAVVAKYSEYSDALDAAACLVAGGQPVETISIAPSSVPASTRPKSFGQQFAEIAGGAGNGAWMGALLALLVGGIAHASVPVFGGSFSLTSFEVLVGGAVIGGIFGALAKAITAIGLARNADVIRSSDGRYAVLVRRD